MTEESKSPSAAGNGGTGEGDVASAKPNAHGRRRKLWIAAVVVTLIAGSIALYLLFVAQGANRDERTELKSYNLIAVRVGTQCGYIDRGGRLVVQPQFAEASEFFPDGTAIVKVGDQFGVIGRDGRFLINPRYTHVNPLGHGLFSYHEGELAGIIHVSGRVVTPATFASIGAFDEEGVAQASQGGRAGFVNTSGQYVVQPQFDEITGYQGRYFREGLAAARAGDRWGFIDRQGRWVINPQFVYVGSFDSEGLAMAATGSGEANRTGFINRRGEWVIQPQFNYAYGFNDEPLTAVRLGPWGFIDRTGQIRINPQYDGTSGFDNNTGDWLAPVSIVQGDSDDHSAPRMWGYIDIQGNYRIQPQFSGAQSFDQNSRAIVSIGRRGPGGTRRGLIDERGRYILNPIYDAIELTAEGDYFFWRIEPRPGIAQPRRIEDVITTIGFARPDGTITASYNHAPCAGTG